MTSDIVAVQTEMQLPTDLATKPAAADGSLDLLIVAAMPEELQGALEEFGLPILFTGLGKVNAAYMLMREIARREAQRMPVKRVINLGTAGSSKFKTHELVEIHQFVQRDMDVSQLGIPRGVTPFDDLPAVLDVPRRFPEFPAGSCGTGDNFEISHPETLFKSRDEDHQSAFSFGDEEGKEHAVRGTLLLPYYDVVDMEAYALAKVCRQERLGFCAIKYISDGADADATNDWQANLPKAAAAFVRLFPALQIKEFGADF